MTVESTCGEYLALTGDDLGTRTNDDADVRLNIGITGLADACNASIAQSDIGLVDPGDINDQGIGDDRVYSAFSKRTAVPAAMSSLNPRAASRSNDKPGLASAKW